MPTPSKQADLPCRLEYTGERMIPELTEFHTFWEHIYRYRFARRFVAGRRVLDIACGEGYGAYALSMAGASSVIGVDISEEVCRHARQKYGLDARCGDALHIPLPSGSVDVVVSFETIEHVSQPRRFIAECRRVLGPQGTLIISTPNKAVSLESGHHNQFHAHEMDREEFVQLLRGAFSETRLYSQKPKTAAWWSLRALSAERSWVHQVRGSYRLRKALLPWLAPESLGEEARRGVVELVLGREGYFGGIMNPYAVRPYSPGTQERPTFFVAVAKVQGPVPG